MRIRVFVVGKGGECTDEKMRHFRKGLSPRIMAQPLMYMCANGSSDILKLDEEFESSVLIGR